MKHTLRLHKSELVSYNPELTGAKRPVRNEMTNEVERVVMFV